MSGAVPLIDGCVKEPAKYVGLIGNEPISKVTVGPPLLYDALVMVLFEVLLTILNDTDGEYNSIYNCSAKFRLYGPNVTTPDAVSMFSMLLPIDV